MAEERPVEMIDLTYFGSPLKNRSNTLELKFLEGNADVLITWKDSEERISTNSVPLDKLLCSIRELSPSGCQCLSIIVTECDKELTDKLILAIRKLFFYVNATFKIIRLELGTFDWKIFSELSEDLTDTFMTISEFVLLPSVNIENGDHNGSKALPHFPLLHIWLPRLRTMTSFRAYNFLMVDKELETTIGKCRHLTSICIGKLHTFRECTELESIKSVDLDGQYLGICSDDVRLSRRAHTVFPNCRSYRVIRHSIEIFKALMQSLIPAGGVFTVVTDLAQVVKLNHILGDTMEVQMIDIDEKFAGNFIKAVGRNERYRTTINFYNFHYTDRIVE